MIKQKLMKILLKLFGSKVRLIEMTEHEEYTILNKMLKIEGVENYFELQLRLSHQLYMQTDDKQYKGYNTFIKNLLINMKNSKAKLDELETKPKEESGGYKSTVE